MKFKHLLLLFLALANFAVFIKVDLFSLLSGQRALLDFDAYHLLANQTRIGLNPYQVDNMQTLAPPLSLLYFFPFSYLKIETARILTSVLNITAGYLLVWILAKRFFNKNLLFYFITLALILFFSFPARFSLELGQPLLFTTLFITFLTTTKSGALLGLITSLLVSIKTFFILTFLAFIGNKKVIVYGVVFLIALFLISLIFVRFEIYVYYFQNKFSETVIGSNMLQNLDYYNQSFKVTIFRFNLGGFYLPLFIAFLSLALILILKTKSIEITLIAAVLLSPVAWQHYFVFFFPLFVIIYPSVKADPKKFLLFSFAALLWWIEFPWIHQAQPTLINKIIASHFLLSALLLLILYISNSKVKIGLSSWRVSLNKYTANTDQVKS